MKKESISCYQGICLVIMFIIGSAIVVVSSFGAHQDVWISIIIALVAGLMMTLVYYRLLKLYPGSDLYDILNQVFGKIFGTILSLLYVWYAFHLGALVIRNFSEFIQIVELPDTPKYAIAIALGITCIIAVRAGIEVIGRWTAFVIPLVIGILIFNLLSGVKLMNITHLLPILQNGYGVVFNSAFGTFAFPFAEIVLFMTVFDGMHNVKSAKKSFMIGICFGGLILILTTLRNILIIGSDLLNKMNFASYSTVRLIQVGDFLQHIEVLVAVIFTLAGITKICVCMYAACKGLAKIFKLDEYRSLAAAVGLFMVQFSIIIYTNTVQMFEWAFQIYKYYALPFQVIIPIAALITAEVKIRNKKKKAEEQMAFDEDAVVPEATQ